MVNKVGLPGLDIESECHAMGLRVIGRLPYSRRIAENYARGELLSESQGYRDLFASLWERCKELARL
jgi:MinD superfamily P-loop ATPase